MFRITPSHQYQLGRAQARQHSLKTAELSQQISSGRRIHSPSDNPAAQKQILDSQSVISHFENQVAIAKDVRGELNETFNQLQTAQQLILNARDFALQIKQTTDPDEARVLSQEVSAIRESLFNVANARNAGGYLFSGTETQTRPYQQGDSSGRYQGSEVPGVVSVVSSKITTRLSGNHVFSTGEAGSTVVRGETGAAGGTGTSSGHGESTLTVQHVLTAYSPGSGITPGTQSVGGDTIIGQSGVHQLVVNDTSGTGSAGTVSLNGGAPVSYSSTDSSLRVEGPRGEVIYLDTTSVSPGFNGAVDITADGSLSLDGGNTTLPIDFSINQTITDPDGNIRHIDSSSITRTGNDSVSLSGNSNAFVELSAFQETLSEYANMTGPQWEAAISEHLESFEQLHDHMLGVIGEQSVDMKKLDRIQQQTEDQSFEAQLILSELQATDIPDAVVQLQEIQNLTQYTLATLAQVGQLSVLDFLR